MNHPFPGIFTCESPPKRILIVRLSAHGDVLHTLPLLNALKQNWPQLEIGWLTEPSALPFLQNHPLIERLHVAQRPHWLKALRDPRQWPTVKSEIGAFISALRDSNYEASLDVQGLLKSAVWPWLAGIPIRAGYQATREWADRFYTHTLPPMNLRDPSTLAVQRYLDFARAMGAVVEHPQFILPSPSNKDQANADALLASIPDANRPMVVIAPFTRWPSKHWEADYWTPLLAKLLKLGAQPVLIGGRDDQIATEEILSSLSSQEQNQILNLVGKTDWGSLPVIIAKGSLLIGSDSAPLHLSDALGKPVIGLYGPTAPGRTGPTGSDHTILSTDLPCQPCFSRHCRIRTHDCMKQLTPDIVAAMAERHLLTNDLPSPIQEAL
jgi:heptosyltransferase I